jgi:hemoglobin-like flavoprotein
LQSLFSLGTNYDTLNEDVLKDPKLISHFSKLFVYIEEAIQLSISEQETEFNDKFKRLGKRHYGYGVRALHYSIIEEALVFTLETLLGEIIFTSDVKKAWEAFFALLSNAMVRGAAEADDASMTYKES